MRSQSVGTPFPAWEEEAKAFALCGPDWCRIFCAPRVIVLIIQGNGMLTGFLSKVASIDQGHRQLPLGGSSVILPA